MKHLRALVIKSLMITLVLVILLTMFNGYPLLNTIFLSLLITGLAYVIGDLLILQRANNTVSTVADIGLCTLKIWVLAPFILGAAVPFSLAFISALLIGGGEWFFHKYMAGTVLDEEDDLVGGH
ncbi:YndM family protein [Evansella sp. LMS18]|uniref:DUF2512 family protein n=1 Tax=Evansella sp. LMS18 TaxID=2924033 RepID=UPI0020D1937E|nr:DUF2512 family protein [Evansella sp. LMS18]UTR08663.1 YndM family protein [Evansella sp. LMS18]